MRLLSIGIIAALIVWLLVVALRAGNRRTKYTAIVSLLIMLVGYNYFFAWVLDVTSLNFCIFTVCLPFVLVALLGMTVAVLLDGHLSIGPGSPALGLALVAVIAMGRPIFGTIGFVDGTSPATERFVFQLLNVTAFTLCLVIPMIMLTPTGTRPWHYWFTRREGVAQWPFKQVAIVAVVFLVITFLGALIFAGHRVGLREYASFGQLVRGSTQVTVPLILVTHFVSFGLTKELVERMSAKMGTGIVFLCLAGVVFAILHYYLFGYYIITKFLAGVTFAYLYEETGSLGYGIVLNCLVLVFLA